MTTTLLLHFDDTNGAVSTTDAIGGLVATFTGGATISTTDKKFRTAAYRSTGGSGIATIPANAAWNFGTGDFTVEFWCLPTTLGNVMLSDAQWNSGYQGGWYLSADANGAVTLGYDGTGSWTLISSAAGFITAGTWHHFEMNRASGVHRVFVNGVQAISFTNTRSYSGARPLRVGGFFADGGVNSSLNGYIDELRINNGTALHTADFTPATGPYPPPEIAISALAAPAATLYASTGAYVSLTPPPAIMYAGATAAANAELTPSAPTLTIYTGAVVASAGPSPTLSSSGRDTSGENDFTYTAPSPTLSAYAGGDTRILPPGPTLSALATGTNWATVNGTAPAPLVSAATTVSSTAQFGLEAPSPNLVGYSGAVISVTLTDSPTVLATGTTGAVGGAQITAPLFELTSTVTAQNYGSANLLAPSPRLGGQAQAWLVAPAATLTAIGSAVITATYEAYALNLGHTPRRDNQKPTDETTHFTNFPFTHIVRYQNSYFGANSTGLYLLEGTTDNGTPIEWEVKTAFTDFDSAQLKTLEMAYFGGRMGPETAIDLYAGELVTNPYEYVTPRGATAQNYRQAFGRGQKARYYALGASGNDVVSIDSLTLNVATLARKV